MVKVKSGGTWNFACVTDQFSYRQFENYAALIRRSLRHFADKGNATGGVTIRLFIGSRYVRLKCRELGKAKCSRATISRATFRALQRPTKVALDIAHVTHIRNTYVHARSPTRTACARHNARKYRAREEVRAYLPCRRARRVTDR